MLCTSETKRLKVKEWKEIYTILTLVKDSWGGYIYIIQSRFRSKDITRDKEDHIIMTEG